MENKPTKAARVINTTNKNESLGQLIQSNEETTENEIGRCGRHIVNKEKAAKVA